MGPSRRDVAARFVRQMKTLTRNSGRPGDSAVRVFRRRQKSAAARQGRSIASKIRRVRTRSMTAAFRAWRARARSNVRQRKMAAWPIRSRR